MSAVWPAPALDSGLRDQVSLGMAAGLVLMVFLLGQIQLVSPLKIEDSTLVIEPLPDVPPPPPPPQVTAPAPQQPTPLRRVEKMIQEAVSEVVSRETVSAPPTPPQEVSKPEPVKATTPTTEPVERKRSDADPQFESVIRQLIESSKRYPTGREASLQKPQGVVTACVVLKRDGHLQEVQIQQSSTYPLLDNAARRQLSSLQYPPMPESSFVGSAQHSFCVKLDYKFPT